MCDRGCRRWLAWPVFLATIAVACVGPAGGGVVAQPKTSAVASVMPSAPAASAAATAPSVAATASLPPCRQVPLPTRPGGAAWYSGPLFDGHFHMPQLFKIPEHPLAPVIDVDVSRRDVACLFDSARVRGVFAFYSVPVHLEERGREIARAIAATSPGIELFLEFVVFPGHPVDPSRIAAILDAEGSVFSGYGEISLYLPHYQSVRPDDAVMRQLYAVAERHDLTVMMHPVEGQAAMIERALRDHPKVRFLFHGAEDLSASELFLDTFLERYPNAYYSLDIKLFPDDPSGGPLLDRARGKEDFLAQATASWDATLARRLATWKTRIEKHPDKYLWGTDRGAATWHYDPEIAAFLEGFSRAFIGGLAPVAQARYAHENAERLLGGR